MGWTRLLSVALLGWFGIVSEARAESPPIPCVIRGARPGVVTVPANLPAFAVDAAVRWGALGDEPAWLSRIEGSDVPADGTTETLELGRGDDRRYVFWPTAPLEEGLAHELGWDGCAPYDTLRMRYSVGPAMTLPGGAATLDAHAEGIASADGTLLRFEWVVAMEIEVGEPSAWTELLEFVLLTPAEVSASTATASGVAFRVPLACDGYPGIVTPGTHATQAQIRDFGWRPLVQGDASLVISCADVLYVEEGSGRALSAEEIASLDRSMPWTDAGVRDAGTLDSGAVDAGVSVDASIGEPRAGTCSASRAAEATGTDTTGFLALAPLAVLAIRRRR